MESSLSGTPAAVGSAVLVSVFDEASWLVGVVTGAGDGGEFAVPGVLGSGGAA